MIKTVIKLAIVALIANAGWRLFTVYSAHWKFYDAIEYTAQYRGEMTDSQVRDRVLEIASQYDIPIGDDALSVKHQDPHTYVDATYTREVEFVPGYRYAWPFTVHIDTFTLQASKPTP